MVTSAFDQENGRSIYELLFPLNGSRFIDDDDAFIVDALAPDQYLTRAQVQSSVRALAVALRGAPFNLQEGDVVLFYSKDTVECAIAQFGTACSGCAVCPVPSEMGSEDIKLIIQRTSPKMAIAHQDTLSTIRGVWSGPIYLIGDSSSYLQSETESADKQGTIPPRLADYYCTDIPGDLPTVHPDTPAFLSLTSGSAAGNPKSVVLTHDIIMRRMGHMKPIRVQSYCGDPDDNSSASVLVITHCAFSSWLSSVAGSIRFGIKLYILDSWKAIDDVELVLSKVSEFGINTIFYLEAQNMTRIAAFDQDQVTELHAKYNLSTLDIVVSMGQLIHDNTIHHVSQALKTMVFNAYASTEADGVLLWAASNTNSDIIFEFYGAHAEDSGTDTDIKLMDENGQEVPQGSEGELWLKSPLNAKQYYKRPDLHHMFDKNEYFHTGDIGMMHGDGKYTLLGRKTDKIKTLNGHFYASQLESICMQYTGIRQCIAVGASGLNGDVFPHIFFVPVKEGSFKENKTKMDLITYINANVPKQYSKCMKLNGLGAITVMDKGFPISKSSNKVDRQQLQTMASKEINSRQEGR